MPRSYSFTPDLDLIARLIDAEDLGRSYELSLRRISKNYAHAQGRISGSKLRAELPRLRRLDIDFYYKPGNENIRGHGAIDLDLIENTARIKCHGDWDWFIAIFDRWIANLGLKPTDSQLAEDLVARLRASLSKTLFSHVQAPLTAGQHTMALSAAVIFIEDRLRTKLGPGAVGMTGSDLSLYAFKNPGIMRPPLAGATNAEDGAYMVLKGWFTLVRNLHGHQTSFIMSRDEVFAQLIGCDYILWLIDSSVIK